MNKKETYPLLNKQRPKSPLFGRVIVVDRGQGIKRGSVLASKRSDICCICDVASANKIKINVQGQKLTVRYYSFQRGIVHFDEIGGVWDIAEFHIVSL